jgi:hypothetical protein
MPLCGFLHALNAVLLGGGVAGFRESIGVDQ